MKRVASIRLLVVDDHPLFREGLLHALSSQREFHVVGEADEGMKAIELWRSLRPDVTLMDVAMYGVDGIETTRQILAIDPAARILMLTSSEEQQDAIEALEAGGRAISRRRPASASCSARSVKCMPAAGRSAKRWPGGWQPYSRGARYLPASSTCWNCFGMASRITRSANR